MGDNTSIKLLISRSHLDHFSVNLGDLSDKQREQFRQDISEVEVRYQGRWGVTMLADRCWSFKRDNAFAPHSRRSLERKFMADI